ncbi:MAG: ribosome-associated translation inhibitor RaiA [Gammaproteobacteria bacterium]|jgi:putative sigma-54 modulation protein
MQINLTGQHVEVTPALKDYITEKLERINRRISGITQVHAILSVEKLQHIAEAKINIPGGQLFAKAIADDMYAAIDGLSDKLDKQAVKHKETHE